MNQTPTTGSPASPSSRRCLAAVAGVFGLALAMRLLYLWQMQDNPCFTTPLMDAAYHDQWARQALRLNPDDSRARFTRAGCLLDLGRREETVAEYRRLLSRNPGFTPARQMRDYLNR